MVEYTLNFDLVFQAMADQTRRDILRRVLQSEQTISELAGKYKMSFAAVAKHLNVLAKAGLIIKTRQGREQIIAAEPAAIKQIEQLMQEYEKIWTRRYDRLESLLKEDL